MVDVRHFTQLLGTAATIVALWVIFGIFTSSEFYRRLDADNAHILPEVLMYQLTASLMWALFTPLIIFIAERLPFQKPHRLRNLLLLLAIAPVFSIVRAVCGAVVFQLVELGRFTSDFIWLSVTIRFHRNIFLFLIVAGIVNLILVQRAAAARERNLVALRTAVTTADLHRLRSSMQPRLMFATLDAIAAKVKDQPAVADRMLVELSHLLRAMLEIGKRPSVTLAEELELIDRYLDIERMRTGGRFTTRVDVDEELLEARVPPLSLNALVTNALLQSGETPQRLEIRGRSEGGMLLLDVRYDEPTGIAAASAVEGPRPDGARADGPEPSTRSRIEDGVVVTELSLPLVKLEATA